MKPTQNKPQAALSTFSIYLSKCLKTPLVALQVVSTRDEQLLAEVCREAAMFSGPPHPHLVSALGLCTSHTPHLLVTQYTDWVGFTCKCILSE